MKFHSATIALSLLLANAFVAQAKLTPEQIARLPAPATGTVDFARDVKPIFNTSCVKCHGQGKDKGGFSLETRESFMKGGDSGAPVMAGNSAQSLLIELVSGLDPENVMPQKGSKLKPEQVATLRAWIDQGAKWPSEITFKKLPVQNLHPRKPVAPNVPGVENPIDRFLQPYFAAHKFTAPKPVDDRLFARRVYLDSIGLLPSPTELNEFVSDTRTDKRERLVTKLLNDHRRYAEHWLTFWNDLLRNDYRGAGYIDKGRKQISTWLFSALMTNMPYDQFVSQLVNPTADSEGFVNGITWRGAVNASQVTQMQAAQSIGQVFMGVNLKCASCHDSFINDYTLADAYGLAAIYATNDLEIAECDKPTGKFAKVKFLYPELGEIDGSLPRAERTKRLAEILTSRADGRLTRTVVNRLWAAFMGRGLVDPVDEMDTVAWNSDLLDWLAEDLADNGYNMKRTMKWILTSRAYQSPSVNLSESAKDFVFTGPAIRRMTAEQYRDGIGALSGVWYEKPAGTFDFTGGKSDARLPATVKWIWAEAGAEKRAAAETIYLRKTFTLKALPQHASAAVACDNSFMLWVNGNRVASGKDFGSPNYVDLKTHLRVGTNVIAVSAVNHTPDNKPPGKNYAPRESDANPAGFVFAAQLRGSEPSEIVSDASWLVTKTTPNGWEKVTFDARDWRPAAELGAANTGPWSLAQKLEQTFALGEVHGTVRASLVAADPLMTALNRPTREQIATSRQSAATTLQGLELTNGETLNRTLKRGAEKLLANNKRGTDELVQELFVKALGRAPTRNELNLSVELVGSPAKQEGVEDLLWSIAMLPEFQLVY